MLPRTTHIDRHEPERNETLAVMNKQPPGPLALTLAVGDAHDVPAAAGPLSCAFIRQALSELYPAAIDDVAAFGGVTSGTTM